jgi:hypothetical protein
MLELGVRETDTLWEVLGVEASDEALATAWLEMGPSETENLPTTVEHAVVFSRFSPRRPGEAMAKKTILSRISPVRRFLRGRARRCGSPSTTLAKASASSR